MNAQRKKIINRLKTIQGHIAGIEKMIEDDKPCAEVLMQISAVRASVHKVGLQIIENNMLECTPTGEDAQTEAFESMVKLILSYSK